METSGRACRDGLHEPLSARLGDGAEVVDEIGLRHADASILDGQSAARLVGNYADAQLRLRVEIGLVLETLIADLVEGIRGVGDQLAQEHILVGVEGADDDFCLGPNIAVR